MVAVDTNVLVYAHRVECRENDAAAALLARLAAGRETWAIPWPCLYEFHSVVTNPKIWKEHASRPEQAWAQIRAWIDSPTLRLLRETAGFDVVLEPLLVRPRVRGPIVHDARIVALCLAHGADRLLSRDRDFSLFPELVVENPFRS